MFKKYDLVKIRPNFKNRLQLTYPTIDVNSIGQVVGVITPRQTGPTDRVAVRFGEETLAYNWDSNFELVENFEA